MQKFLFKLPIFTLIGLSFFASAASALDDRRYLKSDPKLFETCAKYKLNFENLQGQLAQYSEDAKAFNAKAEFLLAEFEVAKSQARNAHTNFIAAPNDTVRIAAFKKADMCQEVVKDAYELHVSSAGLKRGEFQLAKDQITRVHGRIEAECTGKWNADFVREMCHEPSRSVVEFCDGFVFE